MADLDAPLPHISVAGRAEAQAFTRRGGGETSIRQVGATGHGSAIKSAFVSATEDSDAERAALQLTDEELRALGSIIVIDAYSAEFPLKLESLERLSTHRVKLPMWLLLGVDTDSDGVEHATVWVSDRYRSKFLALIDDYISKTSAQGKPRNQALIANMAGIRVAIARDLWRSEGEPPKNGSQWWEVWLTRDVDEAGALRKYATDLNLVMAQRVMVLRDRTVAWIQATWTQLLPLPFTAVPVAEIRKPEFVDTIEDLPLGEQDEYALDLAQRMSVADDSAPAVCLIDTGVRRTHQLLVDSLDSADSHSVIEGGADDGHGHGTRMAGLALFGERLDEHLVSSSGLELEHRLESVRLYGSSKTHEPRAYGLVTAQAVSLPEIEQPDRARVYAMPITTDPDSPGQPTLWSASIDALAVGDAIEESSTGVGLIGVPDPDSARLFVVSAGNVPPDRLDSDFHSVSDLEPVQDPAQAWNALTVGAFTDLVSAPSDPTFEGWSAVAPAGDLSPLSRTSVLFGSRAWPVKPDICLEGGNVLTDGHGSFHESHPVVSLRTTDRRSDVALASANATSAATAQAARLAAVAMARYPTFWPETIRALVTHSAQWTDAMKSQYDGASSKTQKLSMLRRFGWGVPDETSLLTSSSTAVTLVTQDSFVPFTGDDFVSREFRLHRLPWPREVLQQVGAGTVTMKVTLSYFVEPAASRRGWRRKFSYSSHGLRFELKAPLESEADFLARINREAQDEEEGRRPSGGSERWIVGPNQRNLGSLHQDIWEGTGSDLAECGLISINPVSGWWKFNRVRDRIHVPVRYALVVSLQTDRQDVDLYTPIATQLEVPTAVNV